MVARIWHGYTKPEHADAYEAMLKPTSPASVRRRSNSPLSCSGIRSTGPDYESAVIPEERRKYLAHYDAKSIHCDIASIQNISSVG